MYLEKFNDCIHRYCTGTFYLFMHKVVLYTNHSCYKGVNDRSLLCVLQVKVVFCRPEPVKIAVIRELYQGVKDDNLSRLILILQSRIMSKARESIKEIFPFKVDIFQVRFVSLFFRKIRLSFV